MPTLGEGVGEGLWVGVGVSSALGGGAADRDVRKMRRAARAMSPRAAIAHLLTSPMTLLGGILFSPDTPAIIPPWRGKVNCRKKKVLKETKKYGIMSYNAE